jgi:hypothetical protein
VLVDMGLAMPHQFVLRITVHGRSNGMEAHIVARLSNDDTEVIMRPLANLS